MTYDINSIKTLKFPDNLRVAVGMYIGSTDETGVFHLFKELIANSLDEAGMGYGKKISIQVENEMITGIDNGRGIPFDPNDNELIKFKTIFTDVNTGGKFRDGGELGYNNSAGVFGTGLKAVNALSSFFKVHSYRDGKCAEVIYKQGILQHQKLFDCGMTLHGTHISFTPDTEIFKDGIIVPEKKMLNYLNDLSKLFKGITLTLNYNSLDDTTVICSKNGLLDFCQENKYVCNIEHKELDACISFRNDFECRYKLFTNTVPNPDGGTHYTGLRTGIISALNKISGKKFAVDDLVGIEAYINLRLYDPTFSSQTKDKLTSKEGRTIVNNIVRDELLEYFTYNKPIVEKIIEKIEKEKEAEKRKEEIRKTIKEVAATLKDDKKKTSRIQTPDKLVPCKQKTNNEIFIVEGDSCVGGLKTTRDPNTQAIMPIRGMILNTKKSDIDKVISSEVIQGLMKVLGINIRESGTFFIQSNNYDKILIASDADPAGSAIANLVLLFIYTTAPEWIKQGKVYRALSPLYIMKKGHQNKYIYNETEMKDINTKGWEIERAKGLGVLTKEQVYDTLTNKTTRRLQQVEWNEENLIEELYGTSVQFRKDYLLNMKGVEI